MIFFSHLEFKCSSISQFDSYSACSNVLNGKRAVKMNVVSHQQPKIILLTPLNGTRELSNTRDAHMNRQGLQNCVRSFRFLIDCQVLIAFWLFFVCNVRGGWLKRALFQLGTFRNLIKDLVKNFNKSSTKTHHLQPKTN